MNKLIASTGLVALSAASLQGASSYAPADLSSQERTKPWSVSATLRGFYDDNYTTAPSNPPESWGIEVGPSVTFNQTWEQTYAELGYDYRLKWYEDDQRADEEDQLHRINARVNHSFSEELSVELSDEFVSAQEPEVISDGPLATPLRASGDNIRNKAKASFDVGLTRQLSTRFGYQNTLYNYDESGAGSFSALLDRMQHLANIDLRWQALPATTALVGYQFGYVDYTSDDSLVNVPGVFIDPEIRNRRSHYLFAGVDQQLMDKLRGSVRLGAQLTKYPEAPAGVDDDEVSPYADANLQYNYMQGSFAQLGVRHERLSTDLALVGSSNASDSVLDQENTTVYGAVHHAITPKLTAKVNGQAQFGTFNGGALDDTDEELYLIGLNLTYQFDQYWSAEVGYNYDEVDSDAQFRSFDRNRYYLGVTATY